MLEDVKTGEIKTFPSIYKAAKFIDQAPQTITYWGKKEGAWNIIIGCCIIILLYFNTYNKIDFLI